MSEGGLLSSEPSKVYDRRMFRRRREPTVATWERPPSRRGPALHALLAAPVFLCACGEARDTQVAPLPIEGSTAPSTTPPATMPAVSVQPRAEKVAPTPEMSRFVLVGTTISPGTSFAIVQDVASRRMYRLSPGDRLEGMLVRKVESSRVVMTTDGSRGGSANRMVTIEHKAATARTDDTRPLPAIVPVPAPQPYYVEPDDPPSNH
jgi:hypothetical protein